MKLEQIIAALPYCLQNEPEIFSPESLAALDNILDTLEDQNDADIREAMMQWLRTYRTTRDRLIACDKTRELGQQAAPSESAEAGIRQNLFETREIRKPASNLPSKSPKND